MAIGRQHTAVVAATCLLAGAGGGMDAWVFLDHGHVFANAQTGNLVLGAIAAAGGRWAEAARHLPSVAAYVAGVFASRLAATGLKRRGRNSRTVRLWAECAALAGLAAVADHAPDAFVTAAIGFLAGVQATSLSRVGTWSFNTGVVTGDIRSAVSALSAALGQHQAGEWARASVLGLLCAAFVAGAALAGFATPYLHAMTLPGIAGLVAAAALAGRRVPDPVPAWTR